MLLRQDRSCLCRGLFSLVIAAALFLCPAAALDDDEFGGYAADTLTVKVGYFGGPYYEKAVFTLDQLWSMDLVYADYTFIDNMPSVVIDHVVGVRLADLMDAAGIDLNSIRTFYFWTRDKQSDYYTSYPKTELIDTPRYCYYSLPENFDSEEGKGNADATAVAERVDTVIALADDWDRCIAGAVFCSDYLSQNTNTRFRLIFGQTNSYERTASRSAKWIHEIVVELGGAPTLTLDASVLDGEVGSLLRTEASVSADRTVLENEPVRWSSSDKSVAVVDGDGTITVRGRGSAVITATFAGVSASLTVNGIPGADAEPAAGDDSPGGEADEKTGAGEETAAPSGEPPREAPAGQAPRPAELLTGEEKAGDPEPAGDPARGGVQNWRVYEMSETASELGNIETDSRLAGRTAAAAAGLLLASGLAYAALFYINLNLGRNEYAHDRIP